MQRGKSADGCSVTKSVIAGWYTSGVTLTVRSIEEMAAKLSPLRRDVVEDDVFVNKDSVSDREIAMQVNVVVVC